ncbi:MAG: HEAT repeat domain-containing protein [Planctomycetota bacterium]|jgi:hypothetical protein
MGKRAFVALLGLAAVSLAQEPRIVRHKIIAMVGQYIDLDAGTVLSRPKVGAQVADFRLLRRGKDFALVQLGGDGQPLMFQWHPGLEAKQRNIVKTSGGRFARLRAIPSNSYAFGALSVECELNLALTREFPDGAKYMDATWKEGAFTVTWSGPGGRYIVRSGPVTANVSGTTAVLKGLAPGKLHRIDVVRIAESGLHTAPTVATFAAGPRRVVRKKIALPGQWFKGGGGIDLRRLETDDAGADVTFYLYGVYAPGGVQKMGSGEKDFRTRNLLPIGSYKPFHHRLDHDDVYAIRLRDGRYAKVWIRHDGNGRIVNGMIADCVLLAGGGHRLRTMVTGLRWERRKGKIHLRWNPAEADHYVVRLGSGKQLWKGTAQECTLTLAPNAFHEIEVAAVSGKKGGESVPAKARAHTYPSRFRVGTFTLQSGKSYSFTRNVIDARFVELKLAGTGRLLMLQAPHGIVTHRRFGDVRGPWPAGATATQLNTDSRRPATQTFRVKSSEGGIASVRIKGRKRSQVVFEYVYAPPVLRDAKLKAAGRHITWRAIDGAAAYELKVGDAPPVTQQGTSFRLPAMQRNVFVKVTLTVLMQDGERLGPISVATHTFSDGYSVGTIRTQPYGRQWVSFKGGGIAVEGKGELRMRTLDAQRIMLQIPQGGELQGKGAYGTFPDAGTKAALATQLTVDKTELTAKGLLVRTTDGGWASVRLAETVRWRQWTLEFVYRKPVTREAMARALATRGLESPAATRLVAILADPDAGARRRAFDKLVKLGPPAAKAVIAAREKATDPDLRRLLDRWIVETYELHLR